jgi:hypothetical protein
MYETAILFCTRSIEVNAIRFDMKALVYFCATIVYMLLKLMKLENRKLIENGDWKVNCERFDIHVLLLENHILRLTEQTFPNFQPCIGFCMGSLNSSSAIDLQASSRDELRFITC